MAYDGNKDKFNKSIEELTTESKNHADNFNKFFRQMVDNDAFLEFLISQEVATHENKKSNPHGVTKAQVGLGNVDNVKQATKAEFDTHDKDTTKHITSAERSAWNAKETISGAQLKVDAHANLTNNPHNVTKAQVGLNLVPNHSMATKAEAEAGTSNSRFMSPLRVLEAMIRYGLGDESTTNVDWNDDSLKTGFYTGTTNSPRSSGNVYGIHINRTGNSYVVQIVGRNNQLWYRTKEAGTWNEWIEIASIASINSHANNKSNPHSVTKSQVGLGNVDNVKQATKTEFDTHTANKSNPHGVTKSQVGLGSVPNYGIATQAEAFAGATNTKFMSPLRVQEAIESQEEFIINYGKDKTNPRYKWNYNSSNGRLELHVFTSNNEWVKLMELGNRSATGNLQYLGEVIETTSGAQSKVNSHANLTNNPHNVTKSQVGLGSVLNYGIATQAEAEAGTSNSKYMTPLRTKQAIDRHATLTNNPHSVTKSQVGLGSVPNYGVATQAQSIDGTANNRFMTPLRVKEAIQKGSHTLENQLYLNKGINLRHDTTTPTGAPGFIYFNTNNNGYFRSNVNGTWKTVTFDTTLNAAYHALRDSHLELLNQIQLIRSHVGMSSISLPMPLNRTWDSAIHG